VDTHTHTHTHTHTQSTLNIPDAPVMTMGAMPAGAATSSAQVSRMKDEGGRD